MEIEKKYLVDLKDDAIDEHKQVIAESYDPEHAYFEAVSKGCTCPIVVAGYKIKKK